MTIKEFNKLIGNKGKYLTLGKDKRPNVKGKRTYITEAQAYKHVEQGGILGWEPPLDIVVVDIDDPVDVKTTAKALKHRYLKKTLVSRTKKGLHLYYYKDESGTFVEYKQGTGVQLASGIVADIKATRLVSINGQKKVKTTYVVLPFNDPGRKFLSKVEPIKIPASMQPIDYKLIAERIHVYAGQTDGRNTGLVEHLGKLLGILPKYQVQEVGAFIHKAVFKEQPDWDIEPMLEQVESWDCSPYLNKLDEELVPVKDESVEVVDDIVEKDKKSKKTRAPKDPFLEGIKSPNKLHLNDDFTKDVRDFKEGMEVPNNRERLYYMDWKTGYPKGINAYNIAQLVIDKYYFFMKADDAYVYNNGAYSDTFKGATNGGEILLKSLIATEIKYSHLVVPSNINKIYDLIAMDTRVQASGNRVITEGNERYLVFTDCTYDTKLGKVCKHNPRHYAYYRIDYRLLDKSQRPTFKDNKFIKYLADTQISKEDKHMLLEYLATMLIPRNNFKSMMYIVGATNTGKSILAGAIEQMVGENNHSLTKLTDLETNFGLGRMFNKLVNVDPDSKVTKLNDVSILKQLTGNDGIEVNEKNVRQFKYKTICKLFICCNVLPHQGEEQSDAYYERLRVIRLRKVLRYTQEQVDDIRTDLQHLIPYLLHLNVQKVRNTVGSKKEVDKLRRGSDNVYAYVTGRFEQVDEANVYQIKTLDLYKDYSKFCAKDGITPLRRKDFEHSIEYEHGYPKSDRGNPKLFKGKRPPVIRGIRLVGKMEDPTIGARYDHG